MDERYVFKILMLGDAGVGKTCLLQRFVENRFTGNYKCTVGVDSKIRTVEISGHKVKLQIWDTAGEERYRSMMSSYYRHVQGIILVFDTTRRRSYQNVDYWLKEIDKHAATNVRVLLVGNKCDAFQGRQVCQQSAAIYAESLGVTYVEASAVTGANVERLFANLAVNIFDTHVERNRPGTVFPAEDKDAVTLKQGTGIRDFCC
ncbi:ras-related protein ORAB-1-like [Drosophila novamexicana]|uniref:ras-related protein ORAB-1-like n=1 Tax=Drosophila novamexicana TaxID=47314 RepID=UPI0011E58E69|nr:ras-related protein ORAB-1-like [Drosophila novamexicana]